MSTNPVHGLLTRQLASLPLVVSIAWDWGRALKVSVCALCTLVLPHPRSTPCALDKTCDELVGPGRSKGAGADLVALGLRWVHGRPQGALHVAGCTWVGHGKGVLGLGLAVKCSVSAH